MLASPPEAEASGCQKAKPTEGAKRKTGCFSVLLIGFVGLVLMLANHRGGRTT
jgi:hypothetical protein